MAYNQEKNGDIIISGFEQGIAASPHKGIANIQGGNIATETGEVMASFGRSQQFLPGAGGTLIVRSSGYSGLTVSGLTGNFYAGIWIVLGSGIPGISAGNYFVSYYSGGVCFLVKSYNNGIGGYSYVGTVQVPNAGSGSATFNIITTLFYQVVAQATESYYDSTNVQQYRYYVIDSIGQLFVNDTAGFPNGGGGFSFGWFQPSLNNIGIWGYGQGAISGMAVLNGWIAVLGGGAIFWKRTSRLGDDFKGMGAYSTNTLMSSATSLNPHFAFVGHQGKMYYTDGNYIGSVFPNTSLITLTTANIQSYCYWGGYTTYVGNATVISGSTPSTGAISYDSGITYIPAFFWAQENGTLPTALYEATLYYIAYAQDGSNTFQVFTPSGAYPGITGSALDLETGGSGQMYFNTFNPIQFNGAKTYTFTPQRLNLPAFEISTSIVEIGNTVIVGCRGNVLYPWSQIAPTPDGIINLSENNVATMIAVNNMAYIFAGYKGNIYITNGSTASGVIKVPDYCAGIAGTPSTYIEPYFTWGGAMYLRGRVYFSILDQVSSGTGNCGGIWSFIPTQNLFIGQDVGLSLRLENQNSYGTYEGCALLLIPNQVQAGVGSQYFSAWESTYTGTTYGIDTTGTTPNSAVVIETDLIPTGDFFVKETYGKVQYKVASPLTNGDTISIAYRLDGTSAYTSLGTADTETTQALSGAWTGLNFQESQWVQFKITLNPASNGSFCRLQQIILQK